jgi:apoptosis-inducing factor 3
MQTAVEKIIASSDPESKLATGVVVNGQTLPADFVIMGVGVAPATGFLKDSGIKLERDGGIKVDEYLRVPGLDGVYAIGKRPLLEMPAWPRANYCDRRHCTFPTIKWRE